MTDDRLRLAYCGFHPDRTRSLLAEWGTAGAVLRAVACGQIKAVDQARDAARVSARQRREELAALGLEPVVREDDGMPRRLAELPDSPDLLFVRGRLPPAPSVAVVGTRRCTGYGRNLARAFGVAIARAGWVLVSGLARGIDGAAHRGTMDAGGIGVAVLGSGGDVWYPAEHREVGERLVELGGAVISEYPPGTPPEGWRFPPRNRIISGLSGAVVVVEAGEKGGALITAGNALDHGRQVFAVPGDVDRASSRGCNLLIRDGAVPVFDADDLVEALSLVIGQPRAANRPSSAPDEPLLEAIGPTGRSIDELLEMLDEPVGEVLAGLARLEASGAIRSHLGVVTVA